MKSNASRPSFAAAVVLFASACGEAPPVSTAVELGVREIPFELPVCSPSSAARIDTIASGLEVPWDVAFLPDGRAFVTERPGRVREVRADGRLVEEPWAEWNVAGGPGLEVGLMGIDLAPTSTAPYEVFVAATVVNEEPTGAIRSFVASAARRVVRMWNPERGHPLTTEIVRFVEREGRGADPAIVVRGLPSSQIHGGGVVRFGPDGLLYLTNGDGGEPPRAQQWSSRRGKILRYRPDGAVSQGNPDPSSPVFAMGVRHVQGLAWLPDSGRMLAIDHGPTGLPSEGYRTDMDELNVVDAGANLGWPIVAGGSEGGSLSSPAVVWTPALAPAGLSVMPSGTGPWEGSAFITGLRGASLRRIQLRDAVDGVVAECQETLLDGTHGRLRLNRLAPDGTLWIGTSNRDGRGVPGQSDDLILRVHPPTE